LDIQIIQAKNRLFMKPVVVLFLTILSGLTSVYANLGDNGERVEDLYGQVVQRHLRDDGTVTVLYRKDRYLYFVVFDNGASVLERYSRVDGGDLSEKEIAKFLKANAGRTVTWTPVQTANSKERKFERSDHRAEATCLKVDGRLTLTVRALHANGPRTEDR
jgi:hypothetical protein